MQYPHVFEDNVLANLRGWVMEEIPRSSGDDRQGKHDTGKRNSSDFEMLQTYSTALLAVCLPWLVLNLPIFPISFVVSVSLSPCNFFPSLAFQFWCTCGRCLNIWDIS